MNTHTSDAVQGQAADEADDGDYDGYDHIVSHAVDDVLVAWRAEKQAELDGIEANTPERRRFLNAIGRLKPTDVAWAAELTCYLEAEVSSIER